MAVATASPIGSEVLDDPAADAALVRRMLHDIARANRWFGGVRAVEIGLNHLRRHTPRTASWSLLDVGTGRGDLALAAASWGRAHRMDIVPIGLERHRAAAQLASEQHVTAVLGCATLLPMASHAVDVVLVSQLLHHFDDTTAHDVVREAHRVARCGVILADLRPSRLAAVAFRAAGTVLRFHHSTIDDGVTSLARARNGRALRDMALRVGARDVRVWTTPFARVTVAWPTTR